MSTAAAHTSPPPDAASGQPGWWKSATVYQIYPRSFADSDGDGIGDLRGVIEHLDHVQRLGAEVIWLSPVYTSPDDDNGYDISDYQSIDPRYGTMADFDELLAGVHRRDMKLVMDLVVNHTSDEHPWFRESRSSLDDLRRDWYWWRPARPGHQPGEPRAEPNNWGSFFSGPAWQFDERTGEYYLHLFSPKQPDLNWENPDVRQAVYSMMRWWLDRGIDGFRMDVVNLLSKDVRLPDGAAPDGARLGDGSPYYLSGPRIHEFLAEMHAEVFAGRDRPLLTVGETPGVTTADARRFTDPAHPELDMVFQFDHVNLDHGASKWQPVDCPISVVRDVFNHWQEALGDVGWNSLYWSNHDQPRSVSRFGDDGRHRERSAKTLATVLHLQRGTPYVYQGEELAMTNSPMASIDDYRDLETLRHYRAAIAGGQRPDDVLDAIRPRSRDNARTPMPWSAAEHGGFTTGVPWLAANPNATTINAEAAASDPGSVFHHYRQLIELRRESAVVSDGAFEALGTEYPTLWAYRRSNDNAELFVVAQCGSSKLVVGPELAAAWAGGTVRLATYNDAPRLDPDGALTLRPWESFVVERARR